MESFNCKQYVYVDRSKFLLIINNLWCCNLNEKCMVTRHVFHCAVALSSAMRFFINNISYKTTQGSKDAVVSIYV